MHKCTKRNARPDQHLCSIYILNSDQTLKHPRAGARGRCATEGLARALVRLLARAARAAAALAAGDGAPPWPPAAAQLSALAARLLASAAPGLHAAMVQELMKVRDSLDVVVAKMNRVRAMRDNLMHDHYGGVPPYCLLRGSCVRLLAPPALGRMQRWFRTV